MLSYGPKAKNITKLLYYNHIIHFIIAIHILIGLLYCKCNCNTYFLNSDWTVVACNNKVNWAFALFFSFLCGEGGRIRSPISSTTEDTSTLLHHLVEEYLPWKTTWPFVVWVYLYQCCFETSLQEINRGSIWPTGWSFHPWILQKDHVLTTRILAVGSVFSKNEVYFC